MPRFLRRDGSSYWTDLTPEDEDVIRRSINSEAWTAPQLPSPLRGESEDRFRAPWAGPGGELHMLLVETRAPGIRALLRESLTQFCRRLCQDRRANPQTRDLLREYLIGRD